MDSSPSFLTRRVAARNAQIDAIAVAARRYGATALHAFGSVGRGTADAFSDVDAWLTFPDDTIEAVIRDRHCLYREAGQVLLVHEMAPNRPFGGAYALVLYRTSVGPLQVDWYLTPQRTSRVDSLARAVFEHLPVPVGTMPIAVALVNAWVIPVDVHR